MTSEAQQILEVFRIRHLHRDGFLYFDDFGAAMIWENGFVRDEPVREAIQFLTENDYVREMELGLELLPKGERHIYADQALQIDSID
jgi:hypothetical protein